MEETIEKARVLIEALPFMSRFRGKVVVVKAGGVVLDHPERRERLAQDLVLLQWVGVHVLLVHGGGTQISKMLARLGIESTFVDGLRVTDESALEVVSMVLGGAINQELVRQVAVVGGTAVGLTGKDGGLARARRVVDERLGFVGDVAHMNPGILQSLLGTFVPIVAPLAADEQGQTLNINADVFAANLAASLDAEKLVLLTDVVGVKDCQGELISSLTVKDAHGLVESGVASGGMVPKLQQATAAIEHGVNKVHIIDGRVEHSLLLEIFTTTGIGTEILREA